MKKKRIAILGSTGSIGTQTLQVLEEFLDDFELVGLTANSNAAELRKQLVKWQPKVYGIHDCSIAIELLESNPTSEYVCGDNYVEDFIEQCSCDLFVNAISGVSGLMASYHIIKKGIDIALANKESIVSAGFLLTSLAEKTGARIYPIDSEHSALWQCLNGEQHNDVSKLILTASGGPFFGFKRDQLAAVTPDQALKHPTWNMGSKISIDSATLMNKGLEVIEAAILFDVPYEQIQVVVHPQSIVHSLVEFSDGALKAQIGVADMRQPIQYALFAGLRKFTLRPRLDIYSLKELNFYEPSFTDFPCLSIAYEAGKLGGIMPAVMNSANQVAVERFLNREISFLQIPELIAIVLSKHSNTKIDSIEDIIYHQENAKRLAYTVQF